MPAPQDVQQNQGQQQLPPLPPGWEAVYNNEAKRYYFVDHINKKTQWDDPRLTHSFIWGEEENAILRHLSESFADRVPENVIRDALLRSAFRVDMAISELETWNKRKSLSPRDNERTNFASAQSENRGSKRSSPATVPKKNLEQSTGATGVDDFAYLFVKSKFSEVPDSVIQDILTNFNNDEEKAVKELKAMGFAGGKRQAATSRIEHKELNKEEKAKLKLARFQEAVNQLSSEFATCSGEEIRKILTDTDCDFTESRSLLRQVEAKKKMESFLSAMHSIGKEAPDSSTNAISGVDERPQARPDENNSDVAFKNQMAEETLNAQENIAALMYQKAVVKEKITLQSSGNAKGPDRLLYHGPNNELLSKRTKLALGHNQSLSVGPVSLNRKGPDASLLLPASFNLCQSS